jgi:hypothetical protein
MAQCCGGDYRIDGAEIHSALFERAFQVSPGFSRRLIHRENVLSHGTANSLNPLAQPFSFLPGRLDAISILQFANSYRGQVQVWLVTPKPRHDACIRLCLAQLGDYVGIGQIH